MATARGSVVPEPSNSGFSVIPELAGLTRSGKKRLLPAEEVVENLTADIQTASLPDKQVEAGRVSSADNLDSLVPGQTEAGRQGTAASSAEESASKEQPGLTDTQEEPGGGQSRHQNKEVVHSVGDSEIERSDMSNVTSDQDETAKIAAAAAEMGEGSIDPDEVMVIEPSPTQFNAARLPKTMESSIFKAVCLQAHASRAKIWKALANMDKKVEELESLEQEDDDSDDDSYVDSLRKEVGEEMTKVKSNLTSHEELTNNIQLMCGYMMQTRDSIPQAGKIISDAKMALDKSEKDEQVIEKKVSD